MQLLEKLREVQKTAGDIELPEQEEKFEIKPEMVTKTTTEAIDIPTMDHVNLYTDDIDLPQIKPRTLINRNEFYVHIEKLPGFEDGISREEAKKAIGKSVYTDWLQNQGANLHKTLKEKKDVLKKTE